MKKIIKNLILTFILGTLIFSSITATAYTILATDIGYTPKDTTWKKQDGSNITNVKEAIDELYNKSNNCIRGSIHHESNTQLSINLGFIPSSFLGSYYWNTNNIFLYLNYDSSVNENIYLSYFENGVTPTIVNYNDYTSFENGYFISNFAGRSYEYDYVFNYIACK